MVDVPKAAERLNLLEHLFSKGHTNLKTGDYKQLAKKMDGWTQGWHKYIS